MHQDIPSSTFRTIAAPFTNKALPQDERSKTSVENSLFNSNLAQNIDFGYSSSGTPRKKQKGRYVIYTVKMRHVALDVFTLVVIFAAYARYSPQSKKKNAKRKAI